MRTLHFFSGILLALFVSVHLANHLTVLAGPDTHIAVMDALRPWYRNPVAEILLLLAVAAQIVSGIRLFFLNRHNRSSFFDRLHHWTGLYLAFFFLIHLSAVMSGRFLMNLDTNLYFAIAGLNTFPFTLFFVPYYGLSIVAFFGHLAAIHSKKMTSSLPGLSPQSQAWVLLGAGVILSLLILLGLTDFARGMEIPLEYQLGTLEHLAPRFSS